MSASQRMLSVALAIVLPHSKLRRPDPTPTAQARPPNPTTLVSLARRPIGPASRPGPMPLVVEEYRPYGPNVALCP